MPYYRYYYVYILIFLLGSPLLSNAQFITLDYAVHDVGQIRQLVTNQGTWDEAGTNYPGLINAEYPPGSFQEHLLLTGFYIGGITSDGDTLVSASRMFGAQWVFQGYSSAPWDTVHEITRGDTVDIGAPNNPYVENYTPVSDQDFVTRMNDYNQAALQNSEHDPMFIDVIQTSYAWASEPLDEVLIFNFDFVSTQLDLEKVYVGLFVDPGVGRRTSAGYVYSEDDIVTYYPDHEMVITTDAPGGADGGKYTPVGMRIFPPTGEGVTPLDSLTRTWNYSPGRSPILPPSRDPERYEQMSSGTKRNSMTRAGRPHYIQTYGPYTMNQGDTLSWSFAEIMGEDYRKVLENSNMVERLYPDFAVPSPPPNPNVNVETESRKVTLKWEENAEDFVDPNRSDSVDQPFEGYRVYKSTQSANGPWTLLGEFDVEGNEFGQNTGLTHEFEDTGLMNNVEYFYAVTAFSKPDTAINFPVQETSIRGNAISVTPGTSPPDNVGKVAVVPNPYRGDLDYNATSPPWEKPPQTRERWLEQDRRIQFVNLPKRCTIKIYTLSGRLVETLRHEDETKGFEDWNLTSNVNQAVASGIYLFTVKNQENGDVQTGKFVIIK